MYQSIENQIDIEHFLDAVNGVHGDVLDCRVEFEENTVLWADDADADGSVVRAARIEWRYV